MAGVPAAGHRAIVLWIMSISMVAGSKIEHLFVSDFFCFLSLTVVHTNSLGVICLDRAEAVDIRVSAVLHIALKNCLSQMRKLGLA